MNYRFTTNCRIQHTSINNVLYKIKHDYNYKEIKQLVIIQ